MQVETHRNGTALAAFAGAGLALLGSVPARLRGSRLLPVSAAAGLLLGAAAGGVLLYGAWRLADRVAALRSGAPSRGVDRFVAGFSEVTLAVAGTHDCWTAAVIEPESGPESGPEPAPEAGTGSGAQAEETDRPG